MYCLSQRARNWAQCFCSGGCLQLPLVLFVAPLLCLLPVSCFPFCPTGPGAWVRPYKGLDHTSRCRSLSGVFFAADVSVCVPGFPFLMCRSIHTQHMTLSLSFPSGGPLLPLAILRHTSTHTYLHRRCCKATPARAPILGPRS